MSIRATSVIALLAVAAFCLAAMVAVAQEDGARQLTSGPGHKGYPAWSPDSVFILYPNQDESGVGLWRIPVAGGEPVFIGPPGSHHGRYSPDGKYILFDGEFGTLVQLMTSEGGTPVRIVPDTFLIEMSAVPCWSPDGTQVVFRCEDKLWTLDLASGVFTEFFSGEGLIPVVFDWSAADNCVLIYLLSRADHSADIWSIPVDGGEPRQVTTFNDVHKGSLSPDGKYVVYTSRHGTENFDMWVMPYGGGDSVQLTFHPAMDMEPSWSPDGRSIAFASTRSNNWDVWLIDVDLEALAQQFEAGG